MGSDNVSNYASTTLATTLSAGTTGSVTPFFAVGTGGAFPNPSSLSNPNGFIVSIGNELILCSSRTGDNVVIAQRGYDGTAATSHTVGATVTHGMTAGMLNHLWNNVADSYSIDVPSYARKSPVASSPVDDEFESNSGAWTIFPVAAGGTFDFGATLPSWLYFTRANADTTSYYIYKAFTSAASSWQITCKISHGFRFGSSWSPTALIYPLMFISDAANPTSLDTSNSVGIGSWYAGGSIGTVLIQGQSATATISRTIRGRWTTSGAGTEVGNSFVTPENYTYYRIAYGGSSGGNGKFLCSVSDGYTWRTVTPVITLTSVLGSNMASIGFRMTAANIGSIVTSEQVAVDFLRYEANTGAF